MSTPKQDIDLDRIERYFSGTLPTDEVAALERWMAAHPSHQRAVDDLRALWGSALQPSGQWDLSAMWHDVSARTGLNGATERSSSARDLGRDRDSRTDRPARLFRAMPSEQRWMVRDIRQTFAGFALGAILIGAGWFGWTHRTNRLHAAPATVYTTGPGERAAIRLSDGTSVSLNVASRLEVPADYLSGNRTLRLNGEAFFSVVHHDGAPFTVLAGRSATRVLGTSFVVRHYSTDHSAMIAVRNGKVVVGGMTLAARQQATVPDHGVAHLGTASEGAFSFINGILSIEDVPMTEAVIELSRWHRVNVQLGDSSFATKRLNGKFPAAESPAELASNLEELLDARVEHVGSVLTIYQHAK